MLVNVPVETNQAVFGGVAMSARFIASRWSTSVAAGSTGLGSRVTPSKPDSPGHVVSASSSAGWGGNYREYRRHVQHHVQVASQRQSRPSHRVSRLLPRWPVCCMWSDRAQHCHEQWSHQAARLSDRVRREGGHRRPGVMVSSMRGRADRRLTSCPVSLLGQHYT
jgi:hypothetical protein